MFRAVAAHHSRPTAASGAARRALPGADRNRRTGLAALAGAALALGAALPAAALPPGPLDPELPGDRPPSRPPTAIISPYPDSGGANVALAALGARVTGSSYTPLPQHAAAHLIDGRYAGSTLGDSGWLTATAPWQRPWVSIALPGRYHVSTVWLRESSVLPATFDRATAVLSTSGRRVGDGYLDRTPGSTAAAVAPTWSGASESATEVRVEPTGPNPNLVGIGEVEVRTGQVGGRTVQFADYSRDDGRIVSRRWSFGDGATSTQKYASHTYAAPGTYRVTLTVTDDDGRTATATMNQTVLDPVTPDVSVPATARVNEPLAIHDRTAQQVLGGPRVAAQRTWRSVPSGVWALSPGTIVFPDTGVYDVTYTMRDSAGVTSTRSWRVTVYGTPAS